MSEPQRWPSYLRGPVGDRVLLVLTLVLTVFVDLTVAIGVGVAVGLALRLSQRKAPPSDWTPPER
jgi:sulfate permease, SulP family